jgi:hypothetical protein
MGRCRYCLGLVPFEVQTLDHVTPRSQGIGMNRNLVMACRPCNEAKADRCVGDWLRATHLAEVLSGSYRYRTGPRPSYMEHVFLTTYPDPS